MAADHFSGVDHNVYVKCFDELSVWPNLSEQLRNNVLHQKQEFLVRAIAKYMRTHTQNTCVRIHRRLHLCTH